MDYQVRDEEVRVLFVEDDPAVAQMYKLKLELDGYAVTVAPDGTVYASADGLYALRPDGTLKWKFAPGTTHCASTPAVGADGTVYVGCRDDGFYALDPATGVKRWEFRAGGDVDSSAAVAPLSFSDSGRNRRSASAPWCR